MEDAKSFCGREELESFLVVEGKGFWGEFEIVSLIDEAASVVDDGECIESEEVEFDES